jgi:hypothetical protein
MDQRYSSRGSSVFSPFRCEEFNSEPEDIVNPVTGLTPALERDALVSLCNRSTGDFQTVLNAFAERSAMAISAPNKKKPETILAKSQRPELLRDKPWFQVRHIRDSLRARGDFKSLDAVAALQDKELISVVKFDFDKFFKPKIWGWRMFALDIRLKNGGLITEFYATYDTLIEANRRMAHVIYEKWRDVDTTTIPVLQLREWRSDVAFCKALYNDALRRALTADMCTYLADQKVGALKPGNLSARNQDYEKAQDSALAKLQADMQRISDSAP